MTYRDYRHLLDTLMQQGKTTGDNQSEQYLNYAKLNLQRMRRLEKVTVLTPELQKLLQTLSTPLTWLVITEGWCGDAAQNLPVLEKMAEANAGITLRLVLRDAHPELMDRYLTNGARAIPKLICLDAKGQEVFTWGPRPAALQHLVMDMKQNNVSAEDKALAVQQWYNADKTQAMQDEFVALLAGLL